MDDLNRTTWARDPEAKKSPIPNPNYSSAFAALRPTPPVSGRTTPLNGTAPTVSSKPTTPANDSFSNLVSFNSSSSNKNLSLQEQQRRLLEQKAQASGKGAPPNDKLWGGDEQFWNNLGSGRSTPIPPPAALQTASARSLIIDEDEDDLFAELNSSSVKTTSTNAPKREEVTRADITPITRPAGNGLNSFSAEEDDDPFGLNDLQARKQGGKTTAPTDINNDDDDDVLGLLGQPASEKSRLGPEKVTPPGGNAPTHPQDRAVAELVDMGFPVEKAQQALESTDSGLDVAAAVSWLLNQAHAEAREKSKAKEVGRKESAGDSAAIPHRAGRSREAEASRDFELPWGDDQDEPLPRRRANGSSSQGDKDPAQVATEIGTNFLKSAGSLWKQGQKKVQQAYQEFNSDSDSSQPRWLRDTSQPAKSEPRTQSRTDEAGVARRRRRSSANQKSTSVTDEALMLESNGPPPRRPIRPKEDSRFDSSADNSRDHSPAVPSRLRQAMPATPVFMQQQQQARPPPPLGRQTLNRQALEDQASQAYVSSARRRKPATSPPVSAPEPDLLFGASQTTLPSRPTAPATTRPARIASPAITVRPPAPTRSIPSISNISLKASHTHREAGNVHFKRGDYSSAHSAYTTSLSYLPGTHPISMILLTNHALTALKIGEPKTAIASADKAISIIGTSKGESETVDLQNGDPAKPMRDYYGKALMRKAEALEQMERWSDAAAVWREAVEGGHGGTASIQARMRAEKAANPSTSRPKPALTKKPAALAVKRSALNDLSGKPAAGHVESAAAVRRLRAANAAADAVDDEKFALADSVDARISAWKGGKADNLRALLGSLDAVLWPEAGWKKISMADLVLPNKVKIQYMKGIAKVHPDKIPMTATTEHRMIAGAVFSALNDAWDKFKTENGL